MGNELGRATGRLRELIRSVAEDWGLVILLQPEHASFLFDTVGRPDRGLRIPSDHLFCDWLISPAGLIRTHGIDMDELHRFRHALVSKISGAGEMRITTENGTDVTLKPRSWNLMTGEVFTAPVEDYSSGTICVDGSAYYGPPAIPFVLRVENGRVVNLSELSEDDKQQRCVRNDLTRDEDSNVLAELGIGINPGARWDEDAMESEQARGTCHFGFGHNIEYGGQNASSYHFDLVVQKPSIEVDGACICRAGQHSL